MRPVALVTGVGRRVGIGAGLAERLAATGWDVGFTYFGGYDERMPWGPDTSARDEITGVLAGYGARVFSVEADFEDVAAPGEMVEQFAAENPLKRPGRPVDTGNLVAFLCSPEGGWVNGQLLHSNGGWH